MFRALFEVECGLGADAHDALVDVCEQEFWGDFRKHKFSRANILISFVNSSISVTSVVVLENHHSLPLLHLQVSKFVHLLHHLRRRHHRVGLNLTVMTMATMTQATTLILVNVHVSERPHCACLIG